MADVMQKYRAPKAVQEEAPTNQGEIASRIAQPLSLEDVIEIRTSWQGDHGKAWADRITGDIEERVAVLTKGTPMQERAEGAPDTAADLFAVIETSIDALKDLLGITDDDAVADIETNSGEIQSVETRVEEETQMIEERKSAIATAERITMHAEIRAVATNDGTLKIAGYAATFNQEADGLNFREQIAPGAFTRTLQSAEPVFLLVNHDTAPLPLASSQSGTLRLSQDGVGLRMEADLDPKNPFASALASALERGDVDKMSFAFTVAPDGETRDGGLRTLTDVNLYEVSIVTWPAYSSTSASMRNAGDETRAAELFQSQLKLKLQLVSRIK